MTFPDRLAIASRNPGKIREILAVCADWPVRWVTAEDHEGEWPDVEETGDSYLANAMMKARTVAEAIGVPAVADDSGIEVDALGGAPGMRSARYAGEDVTDQANLRKLLDAVKDVPADRRTARYRCVAALAGGGPPDLWAEATCEGRLILGPRGSGGFGYDPIFLPQGYEKTMAELAPEEKNRISHRALAFRALRERMEPPATRPPSVCPE